MTTTAGPRRGGWFGGPVRGRKTVSAECILRREGTRHACRGQVFRLRACGCGRLPAGLDWPAVASDRARRASVPARPSRRRVRGGIGIGEGRPLANGYWLASAISAFSFPLSAFPSIPHHASLFTRPVRWRIGREPSAGARIPPVRAVDKRPPPRAGRENAASSVRYGRPARR